MAPFPSQDQMIKDSIKVIYMVSALSLNLVKVIAPRFRTKADPELVSP